MSNGEGRFQISDLATSCGKVRKVKKAKSAEFGTEPEIRPPIENLKSQILNLKSRLTMLNV